MKVRRDRKMDSLAPFATKLDHVPVLESVQTKARRGRDAARRSLELETRNQVVRAGAAGPFLLALVPPLENPDGFADHLRRGSGALRTGDDPAFDEIPYAGAVVPGERRSRLRLPDQGEELCQRAPVTISPP